MRANRASEFCLLLNYTSIFFIILVIFEQNEQTRVRAKRTNEDTSEASIRVSFTSKIREDFSSNISVFGTKQTNKGRSEANKRGYERNKLARM